jgi:hypothetical protein
MKMTSLKQSYKDWNEPSYPADKDEYYPCLYLDEKSLDQMGVKSPEVGSEMKMLCTVRVSSFTANANGSKSMSLEIIEAAFEPEKTDAAKTIFPNG